MKEVSQELKDTEFRGFVCFVSTLARKSTKTVFGSPVIIIQCTYWPVTTTLSSVKF